MESQDYSKAKIVEVAKSIIRIREMIRDGKDSEGNRPSPQALKVQEQLEAELGHLAAGWITTHSRLVLDS
jgi:hypothetical protein